MYRGYYRVTAGDNGRPLGAKGLQPVVDNLNAHAKARAEDIGFPLGYDPFHVKTHLGLPTIRLEVDESWQVRVAVKAARAFLKNTGWRFDEDLNSNTWRAL